MPFTTLFMDNNVKIHVSTIKNKNYLQFDFPDYLNEKVAEDAIIAWTEEINKIDSEEKVDLIFNCSTMTGFDSEARKKWQSHLKEQKNKTGNIWVVCNNIFIRGAAKTMGLLSGYPIKVTRSLNDVGG
jgi:hypothetical protein